MSNVARAVGSLLALGSAFIPSVGTAQRPGDMTIGIMAGVNYATVDQDPEQGDVKFKYKLGLLAGGFLEVPLLLKFWFPVSNSQIRPFVFAGPVVGFELNCTLEGEILSVTGSEDCEETSVVMTKSTDFGGRVGGGIEFRAGNQLVRVDARYTHGFTNIDDSGDNREIKNRAFAATVGLGFPLGR